MEILPLTDSSQQKSAGRERPIRRPTPCREGNLRRERQTRMPTSPKILSATALFRSDYSMRFSLKSHSLSPQIQPLSEQDLKSSSLVAVDTNSSIDREPSFTSLQS